MLQSSQASCLRRFVVAAEKASSLFERGRREDVRIEDVPEEKTVSKADVSGEEVP